jgi:Ser/Thr protein kinase RdoA (MazF antagonist)
MEIKSELLWLKDLSQDTELELITPLVGKNDELVQQVKRQGNNNSYAVRFAFEKGIESDGADQKAVFADLGRFAAICHLHVERWQKPKGFFRPTWNASAILDKDGLWGDWRQAPKVVGEIKATLEKAELKLHKALATYGMSSDRFGLIHADMRSANILVDNGKSRLIDFDDCGFGWFAYDFAASVSFFEHSDIVPELKEIWLKSYRKIRPFSKTDEDMLDAMILLRRMALLAWVQSHKETDLAQYYVKDFAINSASLAEKFLLKS